MDNKGNLDGGSTSRNPGSRGNLSTSNQQVALNAHESRVFSYLVTGVPSLKPTGEVTNTMDKDYSGAPPTVEPGGGRRPSVRSTSNTMDDKDTLGGGSTNDDPFLSTEDPGGGKHPVRSGHQAIRWTTRTILTTAAPMMIPVSVVIPTLPTHSRLFRIPMSRVSLLI